MLHAFIFAGIEMTFVSIEMLYVIDYILSLFENNYVSTQSSIQRAFVIPQKVQR